MRELNVQFVRELNVQCVPTFLFQETVIKNSVNPDNRQE